MIGTIQAGGTVLACDVGGAIADPCILRARAQCGNLYFSVDQVFNSIAIGTTDIDSALQSHMCKRLFKDAPAKHDYAIVSEAMRHSYSWDQLKQTFGVMSSHTVLSPGIRPFSLGKQEMEDILKPLFDRLREELIRIVEIYGKRIVCLSVNQTLDFSHLTNL